MASIPRGASTGGLLPYVRDQASNATEGRSRHRAQKCSVAHLLIMTISLSGPCRSTDNVGIMEETLSLGDGVNTILRSPASAGRVSESPVSMSGTIPVRLSFPHSARLFRGLYWSVPSIILLQTALQTFPPELTARALPIKCRSCTCDHAQGTGTGEQSQFR